MKASSDILEGRVFWLDFLDEQSVSSIDCSLEDDGDNLQEEDTEDMMEAPKDALEGLVLMVDLFDDATVSSIGSRSSVWLEEEGSLALSTGLKNSNRSSGGLGHCRDSSASVRSRWNDTIDGNSPTLINEQWSVKASSRKTHRRRIRNDNRSAVLKEAVQTLLQKKDGLPYVPLRKHRKKDGRAYSPMRKPTSSSKVDGRTSLSPMRRSTTHPACRGECSSSHCRQSLKDDLASVSRSKSQAYRRTVAVKSAETQETMLSSVPSMVSIDERPHLPNRRPSKESNLRDVAQELEACKKDSVPALVQRTHSPWVQERRTRRMKKPALRPKMSRSSSGSSRTKNPFQTFTNDTLSMLRETAVRTSPTKGSRAA